jgi:uncharacterized protein YwqG
MGWLDRFRRNGDGDGDGGGERAPEPRPRAVARADIEAAARSLGMSERGAAEAAALARESVRFALEPCDPQAAPVGATRFGGDPNLPTGYEWPRWRERPLMFVAQLRLEELAAHPAARDLPGDGTLLFFYGDQTQAWGSDPDERGAARVIYAPEGTGLARADPPAGLPDDAPLSPCRAVSRPDLSLPPVESASFEAAAIPGGDHEAYWDLLEWLNPDQAVLDDPSHRLLGHPDAIQGDMQIECELVANGLSGAEVSPLADELRPGATDWRLLFQVDSDETLGTEWGDVGRIYFWIREQDLAARRFDAAWHVLQCG